MNIIKNKSKQMAQKCISLLTNNYANPIPIYFLLSQCLSLSSHPATSLNSLYNSLQNNTSQTAMIRQKCLILLVELAYVHDCAVWQGITGDDKQIVGQCYELLRNGDGWWGRKASGVLIRMFCSSITKLGKREAFGIVGLLFRLFRNKQIRLSMYQIMCHMMPVLAYVPAILSDQQGRAHML